MIEIADTALAGPTLQRMQGYVATGKKLLRSGAKDVTYQHFADEMHIQTELLLSDLMSNPRQASPDSVVDIETLVVDVERILLRGERETVIVAGTRERVGRLINSWEFAGYNFLIEAVYSTDGIPAHAMQYEVLESNHDFTEWAETATLNCAVLDADYHTAQSMAEQLVAIGIRHIWNFSPLALSLPPQVVVENVIPGYPKWRSKPSESFLN